MKTCTAQTVFGDQ